MPELDEYELPDGTTVQLAPEDVGKFPGAKKVSGQPKPKTAQHEPVPNRARRN